MLQGQKNNCGCRHRRRRTVPDEDRGRGERRFSRSNLAERPQERCKKRIGRPPLPDDELASKIKAVIAELTTYGYRRVHAVFKRQALAAGLKPPNHKRGYRVMKVHGLQLERHGGGDERRHDGRSRRWCADGIEIENRVEVR
jgi:putative transposase